MPKLKRTISLRILTFYGLGNILGAGIYVLLGEVAGEAGYGLLWSFLLAAVAAGFTAITYGALAGKYPKSAGAAVYTERAFSAPKLSFLIGLALALTAIVSSSALLRGFDRYFQDFLIFTGLIDGRLPSFIFTLPLLAALAYLAYKGISESAKLAVLFTGLEVLGLIVIIAVAVLYGDIGSATMNSLSSLGEVSFLAIGLGGFLAFYAFVGFEDMVNVAEEVEKPKKTMPRGILASLLIASVIYVLVAISALSILSPSELAGTDAPLATVFQTATGASFPLLTLIGIVAITNGVLIQIVTSSRILYGLAREGWLNKWVGKVSQTRKTPTNATTLAVGGIAIGSTLLPLGVLAQITSFILLIIFTVVHIGALRLIKDKQVPHLRSIVPALGILVNFLVIGLQVITWLD